LEQENFYKTKTKEMYRVSIDVREDVALKRVDDYENAHERAGVRYGMCDSSFDVDGHLTSEYEVDTMEECADLLRHFSLVIASFNIEFISNGLADQ
jgi:hypothetical protein